MKTLYNIYRPGILVQRRQPKKTKYGSLFCLHIQNSMLKYVYYTANGECTFGYHRGKRVLVMKFGCFIKDHDWDHCKCRRCGEVRDRDHVFENYRCIICGKEKNLGDDFPSSVRDYSTRPVTFDTLKDLYVYNLCNRSKEETRELVLKWARDRLPREDAIKITAMYLKDTVIGLNDIHTDRRIREHRREALAPYIDEDFIADYYSEHDLFSDMKAVYAPDKEAVSKQYREFFGEETILAASKKVQDAKKRKKLLLQFGVADGELVSDCDIGRHDWEILERWSSDDDPYSENRTHYTIARVRCRRCGEVSQSDRCSYPQGIRWHADDPATGDEIPAER